jgi:hypothetical protein
MLTFSHGSHSERLTWEPMYARMARQVRHQALESAKRARAQVALLVPLIVAVVLAYAYRDEAFGLDLPIRIGCVIALVILGLALGLEPHGPARRGVQRGAAARLSPGLDPGRPRRAASSRRGGNAERNRRLTLPSLARHRGHSSALTRGVGLYTVSRHVGQFR